MIPSALDHTIAPEGQHVALLFCQYAPFELMGQGSADRELFVQRCLQVLSRHLLPFCLKQKSPKSLISLTLSYTPYLYPLFPYTPYTSYVLYPLYSIYPLHVVFFVLRRPYALLIITFPYALPVVCASVGGGGRGPRVHRLYSGEGSAGRA